MKLPLSWLAEFVSLKVTPQALADRLTRAGFEVEEILEIEGEAVFEVNVTPNRGDCLSVKGLAREVAGLLGVPLSDRKVPKMGGREHIGPLVSIEIQDRGSCPRYSLIVIQGVRVGPSPETLVRRLALAGIRSVNNVVDVTNLLMVERGQPLHAFDLKKIKGRKILVRRALRGEKILTLDGEERDLTGEDLVIADGDCPIALAGVMGGKGSEVDEATTVIALESAAFDPVRVRQTSKRLGIQTESSYRFERGVDPEAVVEVLHRAAAMIGEISGGVVTADWIDRYPQRIQKTNRPKEIALVSSAVSDLLGGEWRETEILSALKKVGLSVRRRGKKAWLVRVPSYRQDLKMVPDLVEEVARVLGLDRVPSTLPPLESSPASDRIADRQAQRERRLRELLVDGGLTEAIHFSFLSQKELENYDAALVDRAAVVANPLGLDDSLLRPTLIPSLLKTVSLSHRHKIFDARLFELRNIFHRDGGKIHERLTLGIVLTGSRLVSHWSLPRVETDLYDLRGLVERFLKGLGISDVSFEPSSLPGLHPRQGLKIRLSKDEIGFLGEIHPDVGDRFELKRPCFVCELQAAPILEKAHVVRFCGFTRFPLVERDLSLIIRDDLPGETLRQAIAGVDRQRIRQVRIFDLYRGSQVPPGSKSLTFSLLLGREDGTMTDEEIQGVFGNVLSKVKEQFNAVVR